MANPNQQQGQQQGRTAAQQQQDAEVKALAVQAKTVGDLIQKNAAEFRKVIPRHIDSDRLMRVGLSAISRNKLLLSCDERSLLRGMMQAAVLGLELDVNGEAYLVPFRNGRTGKFEATFMPGYKGLIKLMRQSKEVESVHAGYAREGDLFDYDDGDRAFVKHKKALLKRDEKPGDVIAYYCAIRLKGAQYPQVTILSPGDVWDIRSKSRAKDNGPWQHIDSSDYHEMGVKSAIRRAAKTAPISANLSRAIATEDRFEAHGPASVADLFPETAELEDTIDVTPQGRAAGAAQRSTADEVEAALGGAKAAQQRAQQAPPPADDVSFETADEEKARKARERQPGEEG